MRCFRPDKFGVIPITPRSIQYSTMDELTDNIARFPMNTFYVRVRTFVYVFVCASVCACESRACVSMRVLCRRVLTSRYECGHLLRHVHRLLRRQRLGHAETATSVVASVGRWCEAIVNHRRCVLPNPNRVRGTSARTSYITMINSDLPYPCCLTLLGHVFIDIIISINNKNKFIKCLLTIILLLNFKINIF